MVRIITKNRVFLILLILFISCNNYNTKQLNAISILETKTHKDYNNLKYLKSNDIKNILKIAKLNLSKIENKRLDSIAIELIYLEYREYLDCVNAIYEASKEINQLEKVLNNNLKQLKNMKSDYKNSKVKRNDLDLYLMQEKQIINNASNQVTEILRNMKTERRRFENINKKIEVFIN